MYRREVKSLAPRQNRDRHLFRIGGAEDKLYVRRGSSSVLSNALNAGGVSM